jgi:hypothetical protein
MGAGPEFALGSGHNRSLHLDDSPIENRQWSLDESSDIGQRPGFLKKRREEFREMIERLPDILPGWEYPRVGQIRGIEKFFRFEHIFSTSELVSKFYFLMSTG